MSGYRGKTRQVVCTEQTVRLVKLMNVCTHHTMQAILTRIQTVRPQYSTRRWVRHFCLYYVCRHLQASTCTQESDFKVHQSRTKTLSVLPPIEASTGQCVAPAISYSLLLQSPQRASLAPAKAQRNTEVLQLPPINPHSAARPETQPVRYPQGHVSVT